jgi:serine protease
LAAPGGDLTVDQNGDGYADGVLQQTFGDTPTDWGYWFYQGTSMAAPHVSGVAALLIAKAKAENVAITPDDVREALQATAEDKGDLGWDPEYGWGIVDAYAALNYSLLPNQPNDSPVADAGLDRTASLNETVTFEGAESYDPDGFIISYVWAFDDGTYASGETTTHSYSNLGTYTVSLTVTDDGGLTDTDEAIVTVTGESNLVVHVADIEMSMKKAGPNVTAIASVTVADSDGYPVEGAAVSGHWSGLTSDRDSGAADEDGRASLSSDKVRNASGTFTFTVDNVTKDGWIYDSEGSEEFDSISVP